MFRICLFLVVNLAIMFVFGMVLVLFGIKEDSLYGLIFLSGMFGFGGSFFSLLISKWIALYSVNGKIIKQFNTEFEKWLFNLVEFYSKKLGINTPEIAVYKSFDMNAFATGARKNSALIAFSSGLLERMNRNEIEAVVVHEISHISNGDMVTMSLLQGIMNTFVIFFSRVLSNLIINFLFDKDSKNKQNSLLIYNLFSLILEVLLGFLATIIVMWFSRYREFKADAGSAQLVGKEKMISALRSLKNNHEMQENFSIISLFISGNKNSISNLFLSHPTLDSRIEALILESYFVN